MSALDAILRNIGSAPDTVGSLAAKVGVDPATAAKAIAVLGRTHPMEGDTVALAAERTDLPKSKLQQIVDQLGGEGALARIAPMLDRDGDGNPLNDIASMAGGLLWRK